MVTAAAACGIVFSFQNRFETTLGRVLDMPIADQNIAANAVHTVRPSAKELAGFQILNWNDAVRAGSRTTELKIAIAGENFIGFEHRAVEAQNVADRIVGKTRVEEPAIR